MKSESKKKIFNLEQFSKISSQLHQEGRRIVQCHGVFDLVHPGHIKHFEAAAQLGDVLVVSVTVDRFVNKGPQRPVFPELLRAEALAALELIDYVVLSDSPSAVKAISMVQPSVYVKGNEYENREADITGKIAEEEFAVRQVGGVIHFTDEVTFSSSTLINNHLSVFAPETEQWLEQFRKKYSGTYIAEKIEAFSDLKVLVVGESIIDEYEFCEGLGKATKDPILAVLHRSLESYAGGTLAIANHLAGFCDQVGLLTILGEKKSKEDFIRASLHPHVKPHFVYQPGAPTIHKRRVTDTHTQARILEIYDMDDTPLLPSVESQLLGRWRSIVKEYDLVIVADYGHGMMTRAFVQEIIDSAPFLSVNTQSNAGNRGFNTISKYEKADYVCIAGHELALDTRQKYAPFEDLLRQAESRIDCEKMSVTQGKDGLWYFERGRGFIQCPALALQVKDRVGAGDGVLALTSLLAYTKTPGDVLGFLGNLAGAEMVADLGNRRSLSRVPLLKHASALLK